MRQILRLDGAAKYAGVGKRTILDWIEDGLLNARWDRKAGWLTTRADLDTTLVEVGLVAA